MKKKIEIENEKSKQFLLEHFDTSWIEQIDYVMICKSKPPFNLEYDDKTETISMITEELIETTITIQELEKQIFN